MRAKTVFLLTAVASLVFAQTAPPAAQKAPTLEERIAEFNKANMGKPMADFTMSTISDNKLTNKDLMGKIVVIDFWATWCGPCKAAAPKINAMHKELASEGVVFIGANAGERDKDGKRVQTKENAVAYQAEHKYEYTFTYGNDDLMKKLKAPAYPSFLIIDRKGVVRETMVGFNEAKMRQALKELMAEPN
ncbi:MAG: TlpA family protein disulfide reductase [Chthonomonas sp.]|nr:TlpA family protein disulfide reductase [Chthonomonas sp.]